MDSSKVNKNSDIRLENNWSALKIYLLRITSTSVLIVAGYVVLSFTSPTPRKLLESSSARLRNKFENQIGLAGGSECELDLAKIVVGYLHNKYSLWAYSSRTYEVLAQRPFTLVLMINSCSYSLLIILWYLVSDIWSRF